MTVREDSTRFQMKMGEVRSAREGQCDGKAEWRGAERRTGKVVEFFGNRAANLEEDYDSDYAGHTCTVRKRDESVIRPLL